MDADEKVTTLAKDWRQLLKYRASWEEYQTPVSITELLANQKPLSPMPVRYGARAYTTETPLAGVSDASSTIRTEGRREKPVGEINLHARGTNAYAALQREGLEYSRWSHGDSGSDRESIMPEEDIPAQSIEAGQDTVDIDDDGDDIDWS
jgi:RNA polymerase I-specific transcription initiation factor RRN5